MIHHAGSVGERFFLFFMFVWEDFKPTSGLGVSAVVEGASEACASSPGANAGVVVGGAR